MNHFKRAASCLFFSLLCAVPAAAQGDNFPMSTPAFVGANPVNLAGFTIPDVVAFCDTVRPTAGTLAAPRGDR